VNVVQPLPQSATVAAEKQPTPTENISAPTHATGSAGDRQFSSSHGFSLRYPGDWMVASKDQTDEMRNAAGPYLEKLGSVDLDRMAVMIFNTTDPDFNENLNVVITPGSVPLNDESKAEMRKVVDQIAAAFGTHAEDVRIAIETFGDKKAMVAHYNVELQNKKIHEMVAAIPGNSQSYLVTCTAPCDKFSQYEPIFTSMINSMQIDSGVAGLPVWLKNALIGGGVGLAIAFFQMLTSAGKKKAA
jgi:hypothetical protein